MQVSVIIINYNTFELTCNCIASVLQKTAGIDFEIILVDNASAECDPRLFKERFPGIVLVESKANLGFAGGNNLGLQYATGENILLLNSDTLLLEDSIHFIYDKCKDLPGLGVATIKLIYPDGAIQPAARKFPSVLAHFLKTTRLRLLFTALYKKKAGRYDYSKSFTCDWVWGTFFYFPVKNLQCMGGKLSDTYFMYSEDVEWCFHFKKNRLSNYYFSGSELIHYGGKSSTSAYKNKLLVQNHLHFIKHHYGFAHYFLERLLFLADELEERIRFGNKSRQVSAGH
jgi:hypothetical protein